MDPGRRRDAPEAPGALADSPFGPFRRKVDAPERPPGPLAEAGLIQDASIIHGLWTASMGRVLPADADDMEIWQIAVLLGHSAEIGDPDKDQQSGGVTREERAAADMARNRARLAAARGEGPAVEADTLDPVALNQFAGSLSRGRT